MFYIFFFSGIEILFPGKEKELYVLELAWTQLKKTVAYIC